MASTYWQIEINFNNALKKADELDSAAKSLSTLATGNMEESLQKLSQGWQSDSSSEFIRKGNSLKSQIAQTAQQLSDIADSIRTCAKRTRNAEREALELANQRSYGK
ncbi:MAG: WXG100 family type VII secretion target [Clostridiales bacterium]|nr:WXG100 family type VII secretion target [Clostridiales bacterium]